MLDTLPKLSNDHIIEVKNVSRIYAQAPRAGVESVNLKIRRGIVTIIAGESGSGKSTLLKLIGGLMRPDTGMVFFNGEDVMGGPEDRLIPGHKDIKMVAQAFDLNIYAKVYDNIATLLSNTNLKLKEQKTYEVMEFLRIDHLAKKRVVDLSGGEQQRVAIARAIIKDPEILLLDEPFSQVDTPLKNELRADVRRMARYLGITVIMVSHDPLDCLSLADDLFIMRNGQLAESGHPREMYNNPQKSYTARLLSNCNVLTIDEAKLLGISINAGEVLIYPEHFKLQFSLDSNAFHIKDIAFKGFYEELHVSFNDLKLSILNVEIGKFNVGDRVTVSIDSYKVLHG